MARKKERKFRARDGFKFRSPTVQISEQNRAQEIGQLNTGRDSSYQISGSVEPVLSVREGTFVKSAIILTSSILVRDSIRLLRDPMKSLRDRFYLGVAKDTDVALGTSGATVLAPTITFQTLGMNHAFVSPALSASRHEQQSLNCWISGTEARETTAVPASSTLYYSKQRKLNTVTYKHTASVLDGVPGYDSQFGSMIVPEDLGGTDIFSSPKTVTINVNETGKLQNIRVWIEVAHMSASGKTYQPLEDLGISIRSPNLRWGHAHPIKNSSFYKSWITSLPPTASLNIPFNFWRDSFVLWEGAAIVHPNSPTGSDYQAYVRGRYPTFNRDRSMRVIFDDGSPTLNPRHLQGMSPVANINGSPNGSTCLGADWPWFSEEGISPAASGAFHGASGSPPYGWLTGPGGVAGENEWPTTGSNYGAETMKPVYPMLEQVTEKKLEVNTGETNATLPFDPAQNPHEYRGFWGDWLKWIGTRPGLKGTEISGSWEVLFVKAHSIDGSTTTMNTYIRQVRLELTYETGDGPSKRKTVRLKTHGDQFSPRRPNSVACEQISGSQFESKNSNGAFSSNGTINAATQNYFKNEVSITPPTDASIGRTFGVVTMTGSIIGGDFALFYRLSGTLAEKIGESPWWLMNNQFGVPMIPDSSASLVSNDFISGQKNDSKENPFKGSRAGVTSRLTFEMSNVRNFEARTNPPMKLQQIAREFGAEKPSGLVKAFTATGAAGSYVYVCRGDEGSDFRIKLPTRAIDNLYEVTSAPGGMATGLVVDFPNVSPGDRTSIDFRAIATAPVTKGDRIVFQLLDRLREI